MRVSQKIYLVLSSSHFRERQLNPVVGNGNQTVGDGDSPSL